MTMNIKSGDHIDGVFMLDIRNVFRKHVGWNKDCLFLSSTEEILGFDTADTLKLLAALVQAGFLEAERTPNWGAGDKEFAITDKGYQLANASAAKRLKRKSAEASLEAFMKRVNDVNSGPYACLVKTVVVYGSFLRDNETLGDVDIAIELVDKYEGIKQDDAAAERLDAAKCPPRNFIARLVWYEIEVQRYLKNRQRSISLHSMDDFFYMKKRDNFSYKVLLGDATEVSKELETAANRC